MQSHEREVIQAFVADALARGCKLCVFDGEETTVNNSTDAAEILGALATTDEDTVSIYADPGRCVGVVQLVYGNEPGVVISDHTATPEMDSILARANKIGERLYDGAEAADDGQPDEAQEWADYDPDC
jgi:hypothetical protein